MDNEKISHSRFFFQNKVCHTSTDTCRNCTCFPASTHRSDNVQCKLVFLQQLFTTVYSNYLQLYTYLIKFLFVESLPCHAEHDSVYSYEIQTKFNPQQRIIITLQYKEPYIYVTGKMFDSMIIMHNMTHHPHTKN